MRSVPETRKQEVPIREPCLARGWRGPSSCLWSADVVNTARDLACVAGMFYVDYSSAKKNLTKLVIPHGKIYKHAWIDPNSLTLGRLPSS